MKAKEKSKISTGLQIIAIAAVIFISLGYSKECSKGIENGILFCVEILIPSLYLFMVLSAYIVKSSLSEVVFARFYRLSRFWLRLPPASLAVVCLSVIGGYPIGARCTALLYEKGSLSIEQAEKTAYIAVCAGPGFLISFIGQSLLSSKKAGIILFFAELISVIVCGFIIGRKIKCDCNSQMLPTAKKNKGDLIGAVNDAAFSAFNMCAAVILCSAASEIIKSFSSADWISDIFTAILEITNGCTLMCGKYPIELTAFFIGFGGISVHLQVYAALGTVNINKARFILYRLIQGITAMAATYILLLIFPIEISVFNSIESELTAGKSATLIGSAALLLSSLFFVGATHRKNIRR